MTPPRRPISLTAARATFEEVLERVRLATELGCDQFWIEQQPDERDSVLAAAEYLRAAPLARVGTGILPIYGRNPVTAAASALTLAELSGGRFTLGLGYSHFFVNNYVLGQQQGPPLVAMGEYLAIVRSLLDLGVADIDGQHFTAHARYRRERTRVPIVLSAMRPGMIRLAVEHGDGILLWMCSPGYIRDRIVPVVRRECDRVGRDPELFDVTVAVSTYCGPRTEEVRADFLDTLSTYRLIPLYREVMEYRGTDLLSDLSAIGDAAAVAEQVERYRDAGATPSASPLADDLGEYRSTLEAFYADHPL